MGKGAMRSTLKGRAGSQQYTVTDAQEGPQRWHSLLLSRTAQELSQPTAQGCWTDRRCSWAVPDLPWGRAGCVLGMRSDGTSSNLCQQLRWYRSALCHHPDPHGGWFNHAGLAPALCPSWTLCLRHWEMGAISHPPGIRGSLGTSPSPLPAQGDKETPCSGQAWYFQKPVPK